MDHNKTTRLGSSATRRGRPAWSFSGINLSLASHYIMASLSLLNDEYTDSEEEDEEAPEKEKEVQEATSPVKNVGDGKTETWKSSPQRESSSFDPPSLVSYDEDPELEKPSNEADQDDSRVVAMELDSENEGKPEEEEAEVEVQKSPVHLESWSDGVRLPPDPPGRCDPRLQERIDALHRRRLETGYDMNAVIQNKKAFRNPSIYEKLIQFCGIDETGTNLPKDLHDGHLFGEESCYTELAKAQAADIEKREKAAKAKAAEAKIAGNTNSSSKRQSSQDSSGSGATKKKSKWDQGGLLPPPPMLPPQQPSQHLAKPPTRLHLPPPRVFPPQVVSAGASTSTGKTISAFGPLRK